MAKAAKGGAAKGGKSAKKVKKRVVQVTPDGCAHIHASFNNIIVSSCKYKHFWEIFRNFNRITSMF